MIEYFPEKIINAAKKHARECFPEESCGMVVSGEFIPCKNIATDPLKDFKIDTKLYINNSSNLEAIIHSHNNHPHASRKDMEQQLATNVPWGLINLFKGNVTGIWFWGDSLPMQDLIGRPFVHGIYDCYALVRDYYKKEKQIILPMFPRDEDFWKKDEHLFIDNYEKIGFVRINKEELKEGDAILGTVLSYIINHSGVYIGNGLILHHLSNRLSRVEPLGRWKKYITHYLRYVKC